MHACRQPGFQPTWRWLEGHGGPLTSLDWSNSCNRVLTASEDGTVRLWTAGDPLPLLQLPPQNIPAISRAAAPSNPRAAFTGGAFPSIHVGRQTNVVPPGNTSGVSRPARRGAAARTMVSSTLQNGMQVPVVAAQFYYLDRLIAAAAGAYIHLYRCHPSHVWLEEYLRVAPCTGEFRPSCCCA
jgi:hypothetical protein